jgi:hypothetical protein
LGVPLKDPKITKYNKLQRVTHEDMAEIMGYKFFDDFSASDTWDYVYTEALREGESDDDAVALANKAESKVLDKLYEGQLDAIQAAFTDMLSEH